MPVCVRKYMDKWRIIECDSGHIVMRNGKAVDGGGHKTKEKAAAQQRAINTSLSKKGKI